MRCPFKIGEKIVCISTDSFSSLRKRRITTPGNIYEVSEVEGRLYDNIAITGDHGFKFIPSWGDFITIKEYRKQKLNQINNSMLKELTIIERSYSNYKHYAHSEHDKRNLANQIALTAINYGELKDWLEQFEDEEIVLEELNKLKK